MARPTIHSVSVSWGTRSLPAVLSMLGGEFAEWVSDTDELPHARELHATEVARIRDAFALIAQAARETATDGLRRDTATALRHAVDEMLVPETALQPHFTVFLAEPDQSATVTRVNLGWRVRYDDERAAYVAPHVVMMLFEALETLAGQRKEHFAVCKAPRPYDPENRCDRIFLAQRRHAKYCSDACRTRARRANH